MVGAGRSVGRRQQQAWTLQGSNEPHKLPPNPHPTRRRTRSRVRSVRASQARLSASLPKRRRTAAATSPNGAPSASSSTNRSAVVCCWGGGGPGENCMAGEPEGGFRPATLAQPRAGARGAALQGLWRGPRCAGTDPRVRVKAVARRQEARAGCCSQKKNAAPQQAPTRNKQQLSPSCAPCSTLRAIRDCWRNPQTPAPSWAPPAAVACTPGSRLPWPAASMPTRSQRSDGIAAVPAAPAALSLRAQCWADAKAALLFHWFFALNTHVSAGRRGRSGQRDTMPDRPVKLAARSAAAAGPSTSLGAPPPPPHSPPCKQIPLNSSSSWSRPGCT